MVMGVHDGKLYALHALYAWTALTWMDDVGYNIKYGMVWYGMVWLVLLGVGREKNRNLYYEFCTGTTGNLAECPHCSIESNKSPPLIYFMLFLLI